jgi:hypothetical protein
MNRITHIMIVFLLIGMLTACSQAKPSVPVTGEQSTLQLTVESPDGERDFRQGEAITYNYVVTNAGSQSLSGPVIVNDPPRQVSCPPLNTVGNLDDKLDFNESVACTTSYAPSEADRSAGSITSRAQAIVGGAASNEASLSLSLGQDQSAPTPFVQPSVTAFPDETSPTANATSTGLVAPSGSQTPSIAATATPAAPADATQVPSVNSTAAPDSTAPAGAVNIINIPVPAEGVLLPGVAPAGGSIRYSLTASQGQRLTLNFVITTDQLNLVVTGPGGVVLRPSQAGQPWSETLPSGGEYFLEVRDTSGRDAQPYMLQLQLSP